MFRSNKLLLALGLSLSLGLAACSTDSGPTSSSEDQKLQIHHMGDRIPGQYIVLFHETAVANKGESLQSFTHGQRLDKVSDAATRMADQLSIPTENIINRFGTAVQGVVMKDLSADQVEKLRQDKRVRHIEQDFWVTLPPILVQAPPPGKGKDKDGGSTDPSQSTPWGIGVTGTADASSDNTVAYICDTGIDLDHNDLNVDKTMGHDYTNGSSMASSTAGTSAKGGKKGGNGGGGEDPYASLEDGHGHGTHVAGTVGAKDNSIGVIGVAAGVKVVPMKVLTDQGSGQFSWSINAFDDIAAYKSNNTSVRVVVNYSVGPGSRYTSQTLDDAVTGMADEGVLIAMAAGNANDDCLYFSPARVNGDGIYTIASMTSGYYKSSFSNFGTPVDFWEPGSSVYSTHKNGGYATMSGTSMASPHACGILAVDGSITDGGDIKSVVTNTTSDYGVLAP